MAEPFLAELRLMSFNFAPKGWAMCNGQLMPINQNQALFSLLGTTFGGDGRVNFALPNLQGRTPIHVGAGHTLGEAGGSSAVTLNTSQMPQHLHFALASGDNADSISPASNLFGRTSTRYAPPDASLVALNPTTNGTVGGSQAHQNLQPYLVMTWCIALQGIFPSPN
jgi:microcystin-dependent protein